MKRWTFLILGILAVTLGTLGAFLPLLPTTPFLLLALFFFSRSSPRMYQWLLNHPWFGQTLRDYMEKRAVRLRTKIMALAFLWLSLSIAIIAAPLWPVRILLLVIGLGVSIHLYRLRTL